MGKGPINVFTIEGRLGSDPKVFGTVTTFDIAQNHLIKGEEVTMWLKCVSFKEVAQEAAKDLKKGDRVTLTGKLRPNNYKNPKTGLESRGYELVVNSYERAVKEETKETVNKSFGTTEANYF